jgi:sirohydrochlorin cobaltochelatase
LKEGIALLAHGSRDPEWSRPFERLAATLTKRLPAVAVALAYLEHGPSLEEALAALLAKGATSVRVIPVFLGSGGHVKEDLPRLVRQAGAAFPAQTLVLEKPIGEQAPVIEAIAAAISSAGSA